MNKDIEVLKEKIDKINTLYEEKITLFKNKCQELDKKLGDLYHMLDTIELNKIFFHGYLLESSVAKKMSQIGEFTFEDLKNNINSASKNEDMSNYLLAIELFELCDELFELYDKKQEFIMRKLSNYCKLIFEIENIDVEDYNELKSNIIKVFDDNYYKNDLIDVDNLSFIINLVEEVFDYFEYGYPDLVLNIY